jgi:hypothetical protein
MGWKRFDRRRNNKERVVAAYLSDDGSAPMPQLQGSYEVRRGSVDYHVGLEQTILLGFRDEVLRDNQPSAGQIPPVARSRNGAESSLKDWFKCGGVCCRMPD